MVTLGLGALTALMLPFRDHLSVATPALVFVVPVAVGATFGGFILGTAASVAGFALYDFFFLPPYETLVIRHLDDWVAVLVYLMVALIIARVVTNFRAAREEAGRRERNASRLFGLSQTLIEDLTLDRLLDHIAASVQDTFTPRWTALCMADADTTAPQRLVLVAQAGEPLTDDEITSLTVSGGQTRSLGLDPAGPASRASVALVAANRPIGLLVLGDADITRDERSMLGTFANQAALAVERSQLQEQAIRARLLEEIDRWRGALMGAVSHDLRTPLASVKTAVSSLRENAGLATVDRDELLELIELQSDRLARLVTNLLDMTRIDAGALALQPTDVVFDDLVGEALDALSGLVPPTRVVIDADPALPLLRIDHVLIGQVLANLLENSARLAPGDSLIRVEASRAAGPRSWVEIAVVDDGPGIGAGEREKVFEMFSQNSGGGRAGLGLAIAKAFVEAHGGSIWIDPDVTRGARVVFTVPTATSTAPDAVPDAVGV